ncbi:hypothetical protein KC19_4G152300 [Ceratodon purpureus]|uniref:TIR domain-containing protein n=1 Tax=Ceratodon purpureus TaxID=3225 RepID=A0A8T0I8V2_CERPU|nr:hypothetical protein KC19_4G152300 [Ceratodon purpureus]
MISMYPEVVVVMVWLVFLIPDEALVASQAQASSGFNYPAFPVKDGSILALGNAVFNSSVQSYDMTSEQMWVPGYNVSTYSFCGRVMHKDKVRMVDKASGKVASFSTSFTFSFRSGNIYDCGHGMAFTFAATPNTSVLEATNRSTYGMCVFDYLDTRESNRVFAVKFGSQRNDFNVTGSNITDPSDGTIGLVLSTNGSTTVTSYNLCGEGKERCSFFCGDKGNFTAWIDYDSVGQTLEIRFRDGTVASGGKPPDAVLSVANVALFEVLDEEMYVGFSSTTVWEDTWIEVHRISSWNFNTSEVLLSPGSSSPPGPSPLEGPPRSPSSRPQQKQQDAPSLSIVLGPVLSFVGLVVLAVLIFYWKCRIHIFLSLAGGKNGDSRKFTKTLSNDLRSTWRYKLKLISVFLDSHDLPEGKPFPKEILNALNKTQVGIVVVTEDYFTRKWPMTELISLVASTKKNGNKVRILPLFWKLSTDQVKDKLNRDQVIDGLESQSWNEVWMKMSTETHPIDVKECREAVTILCNTTGIIYKYIDSTYEPEYREEIVEVVGRMCMEMVKDQISCSREVEPRTEPEEGITPSPCVCSCVCSKRPSNHPVK